MLLMTYLVTIVTDPRQNLLMQGMNEKQLKTVDGDKKIIVRYREKNYDLMKAERPPHFPRTSNGYVVALLKIERSISR